MLRLVLPAVLISGAFLGFGTAASAASLSISVSSPERGEMTVTQTGETEQSSVIALVVVNGGDDCPVKPMSGVFADVPAGPFSRTTKVPENQGGAYVPGPKRVCGYLSYSSGPRSEGGYVTDDTPRVSVSEAPPVLPLAVRALGLTALWVNRPVISSVVPFCVTATTNHGPPDCVVEASASIKVSAATRRKLGLRSTTIASGGKVVPCGEAECLRLTASQAVRDRLKKVKSVRVVYAMKVTAPIKETITQHVTLVVQKTSKLAKGVERLAFRSADDTFKVSGRE